METKICKQCGEPKSIKAFGISRGCCIACTDLSYRLRLKLRFFDLYGKICNCCGQTDPRFLTLDHVNNDGAAHRKLVGNDSSGAMRVATEKHRPDLYQILCYNCNMGRAANKGLCPHNSLPLDEYLEKLNQVSERLNTKREAGTTPVEAKAKYDRERKLKTKLETLKTLLAFTSPETIAKLLSCAGKEELQ